MLIVCILLALLCAGLAFWVWAQRRSLREAAYRLRALEDTGSTARVRLAVPTSAAAELLAEVTRLLALRQADKRGRRIEVAEIRKIQRVVDQHSKALSVSSVTRQLVGCTPPAGMGRYSPLLR